MDDNGKYEDYTMRKEIRLYIVELLMRLQIWLVPEDTPECEDLCKFFIDYSQRVKSRLAHRDKV